MTYFILDERKNDGIPDSESVVVGRNATIAEIWRILKKRSVYTNDLRRIGKTMILRAMKENPKEDWIVIKRDLGRCHSPEEFAALVYRDVLNELKGGKKMLRKMQELVGEAGGVQVGPVKMPDGRVAPWKEVLERTFADLDSAVAEKKQRALFLWDEVPFLLDNVIKNSPSGDGDKRAMQVLDVMRSLGQDYPQVKMVLTGSIGLHHILRELRDENYINSPLNDMKPVAPGPLAEVDGIAFAEHMLKERGVAGEDGCAEEISTLVGHVPFYIESFVDGLREEETIRREDLEKRLAERLTSPDDDWDLPHYANRLQRYYGKQDNLALALLDHLASEKDPLSNQEILEALTAGGDVVEMEMLRKLLKLLHRDHYLEKDLDGRWAFRLAMVKRWWKLDRGI